MAMMAMRSRRKSKKSKKIIHSVHVESDSEIESFHESEKSELSDYEEADVVIKQKQDVSTTLIEDHVTADEAEQSQITQQTSLTLDAEAIKLLLDHLKSNDVTDIKIESTIPRDDEVRPSTSQLIPENKQNEEQKQEHSEWRTSHHEIRNCIDGLSLRINALDTMIHGVRKSLCDIPKAIAKYNEKDIDRMDEGISQRKKEKMDKINKRKIFQEVEQEKKRAVRKWLKSECKLSNPEYYEMLIQNGYRRLSRVHFVADKDLKRMGIKSKADRKVILEKARKIKVTAIKYRGSKSKRSHQKKEEGVYTMV